MIRRPLLGRLAAVLVATVATSGFCSWNDKGQAPTEQRVIEEQRVRSSYVPYDQLIKTSAASFDDASCSVRVTVEPGIALLVWESSNGRRSDFLTKVTFQEKNEVIEGADLLKRFQKRSRAIYVLEHK